MILPTVIWRSVRGKAAFTLVEMLVVVLIIALAMSLILVDQRSWSRDAEVQAAAERFAGVCRLARAKAMADLMPYAIAINIQNQPGSSGRVINNRSGGHWYRMLGPVRNLANVSKTTGLLIAYPTTQGLHTFPEFIEQIKESWIGPQYQLPAGKVRFLALGDTDEGARVNGGNQANITDYGKGYGYVSTYPRPWFGYYDPARQRLFPWGGYDPQLSASEPWTTIAGSYPVTNYTGFFYQGSDPPVVGCVNLQDRSYNVDWDGSGVFSGTNPTYGPELGYKVFTAGQPRPLVSGDWQDFLIVFRPDGSTYCPPLKTNRKRFSSQQVVIGGSNATYFADGVADTAKPWVVSGAGITPGAWGTSYNFGVTVVVEQAEVGHFYRNSGAYYITFASDSSNDQDSFPDARAALASLGSTYRVEVSVQGGVRVFRVAVRGDGALSGLPVYPSSPSFWCNAPGVAIATMANDMRWGFLQQPYTRTGTVWSAAYLVDDAIPRGHPIVDFVTPRMLSDKIWWLDD